MGRRSSSRACAGASSSSRRTGSRRFGSERAKRNARLTSASFSRARSSFRRGSRSRKRRERRRRPKNHPRRDAFFPRRRSTAPPTVSASRLRSQKRLSARLGSTRATSAASAPRKRWRSGSSGASMRAGPCGGASSSEAGRKRRREKRTRVRAFRSGSRWRRGTGTGLWLRQRRSAGGRAGPRPSSGTTASTASFRGWCSRTCATSA
mmetsp:Transcript_18736/g.61185  ORF Transcript_18736/g.61185 Transcript_18736/m.61185 type:complete len:207 (-) Transcript_18736:62-682(-)